MKRLWPMAIALLLSGCAGFHWPDHSGPAPQPTPTPAPEPTPEPTPEPVCAPGQTYGCWHLPPVVGRWQYACPAYDEAGQVVGVVSVDGPAQCPAKPEPPAPPSPPGPPAPGEGCLLPIVDVVGVDHYAFHYGNLVNEVLAEITGCAPGSICLLGDETQRHFQARAIAGIRARGLCAGDDEGAIDQVSVAAAVEAVRENYDVFSGDDSDGPVPPGEPKRKVRWYPGGKADAWRPAAAPDPGDVTPPPVTPPDDTPSPPGDVTFGCDAPLPLKDAPRSAIKVKYDPRARSWQLDATALVWDCDYCESIGMGTIGGVPRCTCPVRPDGHPKREACERYYYGGEGPLWRSDGTCVVKDDNRALATCTGTWAEACRVDGTHCTRVDLVAS